MGASLDSRTYLTDDKKIITSKWDADVEHSQSMNGCSYSGAIGMLTGLIVFIRIEPLASHDEAIEYIAENHRKFEGPMAVPFKIQGKKAVPTYVKNAITKYEKAKTNKRESEDKVRQDFYNAKSQFVGCKKCKSKLSRSFLKTTFCPICNQNLLSTTSLQRIEKTKQKVQDTCTALEKARTKARQQNYTGKIGYVVGGICSS
jgi:hypothetical protein